MRMRRTGSAAFAVTLALVPTLAGCGDDRASTTDPAEPLAARAYLVVQPDGSARLCDVVAGLPPELADGLSADAGRRWSDQPVQLIGSVRAGVFVNDPAALAVS